MVFVACGLNHKTAPLPMREKFARPLEAQENLLNHLLITSAANEAAMLSTCNRTEFYCETDTPNQLIPWLADKYQICSDELKPFLYLHPEHHGIRHTLRVASGLDSMMLGEPQILGQMKQAYQHACQLGTIKNNLRTTFEYIFRASKRIRNRSGISNNPVSVAYAAVQLVGQMFADFYSLRVFLIGSGETSSLVAKYLKKQGVHQFFIASRSLENAEKLAASFEGHALNIGDIPQYLSEADIIISATACPLPFINQSLVRHALEKRQYKPMFFLDLAVPRDIEDDVRELEQIQLYNIDDLQTLIKKGMNERQAAAVEAEQLINIELDNYIRWHRSLKAKSMICNYRAQMEDLAQQELQRALQKLSHGHDQQSVLNEFGERLLNKLTHSPTVGLRKAARDGREELLTLANYLFNPSTLRTSYEDIS
ncbi:glutamyl-tRNA reductase [Legionella israelensis]|uniref:glutamyl-tRNA reductase n=1 Tax=Legionella israelensis TaxID=454 RepID=UPI00117E2DE7|nr:glutamyl-tRNA reductase [Legionella israelensis]QDP73195.1 glutamyl-tRNA reductase [Legionella israelensis]